MAIAELRGGRQELASADAMGHVVGATFRLFTIITVIKEPIEQVQPEFKQVRWVDRLSLYGIARSSHQGEVAVAQVGYFTIEAERHQVCLFVDEHRLGKVDGLFYQLNVSFSICSVVAEFDGTVQSEIVQVQTRLINDLPRMGFNIFR